MRIYPAIILIGLLGATNSFAGDSTSIVPQTVNAAQARISIPFRNPDGTASADFKKYCHELKNDRYVVLVLGQGTIGDNVKSKAGMCNNDEVMVNWTVQTGVSTTIGMNGGGKNWIWCCKPQIVYETPQ